MSYVDSNLMSGEDVVHKARMHWFIYLPSIVLLGLGVYLIAGMNNAFGLIFIFASLITFLSAFIKKKTTELAITSKRVIAKFGLIKRNTIELNHSKVESYSVDQSIMGRLFGFGTIVINGTGGGQTPIPSIDNPMEFRKFAMETIDNT